MANLLQSSESSATKAPDYYNTYLSDLATKGATAAGNAQYIGAQPLQQQAFDQVAGAASAYKPTLESAGNTLQSAADYTSPLSAAQSYLQSAEMNPAQRASGYMSPYVANVVNAIGDAGQRNIMQNLAPQATAGAVGSGQFGSKRGAEVLGQTIANANKDIQNQQYQALNSGYSDALKTAMAQNQLESQLGSTAGQLESYGQQNLTTAGKALSDLASTNQNLSLADINALSTLGGQQQTILQNQQNYPLTNLSTLAGMLRGYNVPTTTTKTATGSPLSALATMGSIGNAVTNGALGTLLGAKLTDYFNGTGGNTDTTSTGNTYGNASNAWVQDQSTQMPSLNPANIDPNAGWSI
jgi:hypothetical protein